jgi:hypothetical protein
MTGRDYEPMPATAHVALSGAACHGCGAFNADECCEYQTPGRDR